jgi:RNA polymerase sigma-70 factor (ECF subfamily)
MRMRVDASHSTEKGSADQAADKPAGAEGAGRSLPRSSTQMALSPVGRLDVSEFAEEFRSSARALWTIAAGIVNDPAGADDVVQEAALTALGKLDEFEPRTNFTAWMAKIVRFVALNHARRDRRQPAALDPTAMDDALAAKATSSGAARLVDEHGRLIVDRSPFDDRMMQALSAVTDTARACLLLRTIEGLDYNEIARLLDIPPGTAMSHVHRTRMFLRQRLADMDPAARATA